VDLDLSRGAWEAEAERLSEHTQVKGEHPAKNVSSASGLAAQNEPIATGPLQAQRLHLRLHFFDGYP